MREFIFFPKWQKFIVYLDRVKSWRGIAVMAYECDVTAGHLLKILSRFKTLGLITTKREGRRVNISLTEKGIKLSDHLYDVGELASIKHEFKVFKEVE